MLQNNFRVFVLGSFVLFSGGVTSAEDLWSLYEPACLSNGIDSDPCRCILDEVVKTHGEKAARYVGLEMLLRYEEATAMRDAIGEDKAFAASSLFDIAQNKHCTAGRLARLKGTYTGSGTGTAAASITATASDAAQTQSSKPTGRASGALNVVTSDAPVFDLRNYPQGAVVDVTAALNDEMFKIADGKNLRNYVGFYRITDIKGGIDTNGDGRADVRPGDAGYAKKVQVQGVSSKLYLSKDAGKSQYLGEVHLEGGALYAPYIRFKGKRGAAGFPGDFPFSTKDKNAMADFLRKGMKNPTNLYFVFVGANPDGAIHLTHLGNSKFGFEDKPNEGDKDFDDVILSFGFTEN